MSDRVVRVFERDLAHSAVVPSSRVIRSAEVAHVGGRPAAPVVHTPTVEVVTEADIVRAIDVTCSCGQKMRVWCSYEPGEGSAPEAPAA